MRAGYLFQVINLVVSILSVPLLLRYLNVGEYVLWAVFTTFGTVTAQLQNAIQFVSTRQIAYAHVSADPNKLNSAILRTKAAYRRLLLIIVGPFFLTGVAYLNYVAKPHLGINAVPEWCVFVIAYLVTYEFAPNNAILLGSLRVSTNNHILSFTRVLYFACTFLTLKAGLSIAGICLSFLVSQVVGSSLGAYQARKCLTAYRASPQGVFAASAEFRSGVQPNIRMYAVYMIASFALYNGSLLIATALFPKGAVASYALGLQSNMMLLALAQVPLQVWLSRFVGAIVSRDERKVMHELSVSIVVCNAVFLTAFASLAIFGNVLLGLLRSHVMLPATGRLLLMSVAFLVELNIALLVNFLVNKGNYRFVRVYAVTSGIAILIGLLVASIFDRFMLGLIAVPLVLQVAISLPFTVKLACAELDVTATALARGIGTVLITLYRTGGFNSAPDVAGSSDGR
jgi:hypothetical protein